MAQYGRPDSDVVIDGWTTTPLYQKVDEVTPSDSDYITGQTGASTVSTCELGTGNTTDPSSSSGHVLRVRAQCDGDFGGAPSITYALFDGSTQICSTNTAVTTSWVTYTHTLTSGEADNIGDYSDLRVKITSHNTFFGHYVRSSWVEFECPDAPSGTPITDNQDAYLDGQDTVVDDQNAYLDGQDVSTDNTNAYLEGHEQPTDNQLAYLRGGLNTVDNQNGYTSGKSSVVDNSPAYIFGQVLPEETSSQIVYLDGQKQLTDNQLAFLKGGLGANDNSPAFLNGQDTVVDNLLAYLEGIAGTLVDNQIAFLKGGLGASGNSPAFLSGQDTIIDNLPAYLYSGSSLVSQKPAFLYGEDMMISYVHAYTNMAVPSSSTHAFLKGSGLAVSYVTLEDSNGTIQKKFRVVQRGYGDGISNRRARIAYTVGGKPDISIGSKIPKQWVPIVRVKGKEVGTNYGDIDDLVYFYELNDPDGSPSNVIRFVDHWSDAHYVHIVGNLVKKLIASSNNMDNNLYFIKIVMVEI